MPMVVVKVVWKSVTAVEIPEAGWDLRLTIHLPSGEFWEKVYDPKPPGENNEGFNNSNGHREHLELSWKIGDTKEDREE